MSDSPLSASELAEIAKRAESATPGPWERVEGDGIWYNCECAPKIASRHDHRLVGELRDTADLVFIAAARTDIPRLVADLRAARETLERLAQPDEAVVEAAMQAACLDRVGDMLVISPGIPTFWTARMAIAAAIKAAVSVCQET